MVKAEGAGGKDWVEVSDGGVTDLGAWGIALAVTVKNIVLVWPRAVTFTLCLPVSSWGTVKNVVKFPPASVAGTGEGIISRLPMANSVNAANFGKLMPVTVIRAPGGPSSGLIVIDLAGTE